MTLINRLSAIVILLLSLTACSEPKSYTVEIDRQESDGFKTTHIDTVKHSITAEDDSVAFTKGLLTYYSFLLSEHKSPGLIKTLSFRVYDRQGSNLALKVKKNVLDSLAFEVKNLPSVKGNGLEH